MHVKLEEKMKNGFPVGIERITEALRIILNQGYS